MTKTIVALLLIAASCGPSIIDKTEATDMSNTSPAPVGFGSPCQSSTECRQFHIDAAPGFLGCESYLRIGANYCSGPCGMSANGAPCWQGSTCDCVQRNNAGDQPETDCYCAK